MVEVMNDFARARDFRIARKTNPMTEAKALECFSTKKAIQRGWFYCSLGKGSDKECTFKIQFTYNFQQRQYETLQVIRMLGLLTP